MSTTLAAPVNQSERIVILDSLRGIAILGILLMNIPGFALPDPAAYGDLSVLNEMGTINFKVWYFIDWFMEGSQRALFSMLFGAGIILFITRQEKKAEGLYPADYFFRRQLWLLVFGLFNAFVLLWFWRPPSGQARRPCQPGWYASTFSLTVINRREIAAPTINALGDKRRKVNIIIPRQA